MTTFLIDASTALFAPGRVSATAKAATVLRCEDLVLAMARHLAGDWGEVDAEVWERNEAHLKAGGRLSSRYTSADGVVHCVVTEENPLATTVLLPDEFSSFSTADRRS
ncbi:MAG: hypothetical protein L0387_02985 [Acidobacteria bacterium]|nr:hypothetical protein [Acidobacteriota bacterium]MCI0724779.1 hypothetical protein [Acidobacteriota bacterium]